MLTALCYYQDLSRLLSGWSSPTLQTFYLIEIALWIVGILAGRLVPHSRLRTAVCVAVGIVGLLMFLWPICFGLSSDAGVPVPFLGESLLLGAVLALCIPAQKKRHTGKCAGLILLIVLFTSLTACTVPNQNCELEPEAPVGSKSSEYTDAGSGDQHAFQLIQAYVHEIVQIKAITEDQYHDYYKADCDTIYSSKPERLGCNTVYFHAAMLPELKCGQIYLVELFPLTRNIYIAECSSSNPLTVDAALCQDGHFEFDFNDRGNPFHFFALRIMNYLVQDYATHPDPAVPSMPTAVLPAHMTIQETIDFLSSMKNAQAEWLACYH